MLLYITLYTTHTSHIRDDVLSKQSSKQVRRQISLLTSMVGLTGLASMKSKKEQLLAIYTIFMFHGMSYSIR